VLRDVRDGAGGCGGGGDANATPSSRVTLPELRTETSGPLRVSHVLRAADGGGGKSGTTPVMDHPASFGSEMEGMLRSIKKIAANIV